MSLLIALKGRQGDDGIQGIQGIQGIKGDKGDTGAAGFFTSRCSVRLSEDQSAPQGQTPKIAFDTKVYDTDNEFDEVTNYRFQPIANGWYHISISVRINDMDNAKYGYVFLRKNGDNIRIAVNVQGTNGMLSIPLNCDVYLTTEDYLEVHAYHTNPDNITIESDPVWTWMDIHQFG